MVDGGELYHLRTADEFRRSYEWRKNDLASDAVDLKFNIVPVASTTQDYQKRYIRLDPSGRPKSSEGACS